MPNNGISNPYYEGNVCIHFNLDVIVFKKLDVVKIEEKLVLNKLFEKMLSS